MMLISLLNLIALWDGIKQKESNEMMIPTLNLSVKKKPVSVLFFCAILEIVVIILTLSHVYPVKKSIARLSERWERLYAAGDESLAIKSLQDAAHCCGLTSVTDKAWPFENNGGACHEIYEREESCLRSWLESQQLTAVLIIIVILVTLVLKGVLMGISLCFGEKIRPLFEIHDDKSILDQDLESGLYDLEAISSVKATSTLRVSATRRATRFRNRNGLIEFLSLNTFSKQSEIRNQ